MIFFENVILLVSMSEDGDCTVTAFGCERSGTGVGPAWGWDGAVKQTASEWKPGCGEGLHLIRDAATYPLQTVAVT